MVGKIVISSGGYLDGQRTPEFDKYLLELCGNKKILILDNATLSGSNTKGVPVIKHNFEQISNNVKVISLMQENIDILNEVDIVYITGGDTTPLFDLSQNMIIKKAFADFVKKGGIFIGESAGSIIFSKDAKYYYDVKKGTKPKYDIVRESFAGFGFIDLNIYPHYNKAGEEQRNKVDEFNKTHEIQITPMCDGEWVTLEVDNLKLD